MLGQEGVDCKNLQGKSSFFWEGTAVADTRRGISWSLERPCPLRHGTGWELPEATQRQLAYVSMYSRGLHDNFVVDDVCVTGYTFGSDSARNSVMLPCSGFRVSLALAPLGGEAAVR